MAKADEIQEEQEGEVIELSEDTPPEVETTDDGGAIVKVDPNAPDEEVSAEFYDNIVDQFEEVELEALAHEILQNVEYDQNARKERDDQYAEAIKRTGLGKEAPGGASFTGASRAVHPLLAEAVVDFEARAIKELMPPNGPVRIFIPGDEPDQERVEKAERKKDYMNWQFQFQMPEFRSELEQLLTQVPLGGSMYLRLTPDFSHRKHRPRPLFVPLDYVLIPSAASNYYSAERQTYCERITKSEFETRTKEEMYREINLISPSQPPDQTEPEKATDKIEGKNPSQYNEDGLKTVYEVSMFKELEDEHKRAPYLISVDEPSHKVVSIVRNWEEDDEEYERMQWMVEFGFIPWRGAYHIGLGQMVGSLSGAATGALRALLDSAHIQNIPTLARLKGANFSGQSQTVSATQIIDIEGGVSGTADIRALLMPIPFNGPSEALFKLLGFVVDAGRGFIHIAMDKLAEGNKNLPVGTTLALIEEGMKVQAAIHLRLYHSMSYVIRILHRINRMYLNEGDLKNDIGEVLAHRKDFDGPLDCIPTADPEIFTDVQRIAQAQIVADRAAAMPDLYNRRETEKILLERAKIPFIDRILIPEPKAEEMNAVNENVAMTLGRPVVAFPEQDHLAHIQVLLDFLTNPMLGMNPIILPTFMPAALGHLKEHIVYWYVDEFQKLLKDAVQVDDDGLKAIMKERDPETRAELDRLLAEASQKITPRVTNVFQQLPPIIMKAQELVGQISPPMQMPTDPNKMAAVEAKKQGDQLKAKTEEKKLQVKAQELAQESQESAADREADMQQSLAQLSAEDRREAVRQAHEDAGKAQEYAARLSELEMQERAEDERTAASLESDERRNTQDNETALRIAAAEIESAEKVEVSTGTGINP